MKLKEVFINLLKEGEEEPVDDSIIEFPEYNFSVSLFKDEKRIIFSPQNCTQDLPEMVDAFVEIMKEKYAVSKAEPKEVGTFEVVFDPREDFESVLTFIKQQVDLDNDEEEQPPNEQF